MNSHTVDIMQESQTSTQFEDKKDIKVVKSGESFDISFTVVAYMKIEDPVFAMTIRTLKNLGCMVNTLYQD